jgi:hypothetical protein
MAAIQGDFFGLPLATLQELQAEYVTAIRRLAQGQSYAIDGRQLTRVDLMAARETLREINAAITAATGTGTGTRVTYVQTRSGYPR